MPTQHWLNQYKKMDKEFNTHHPPNSVRSGRGLFRNFFVLLKTKFSNLYDDKVLHLVTRMITRFRIFRMNKITKEKEIAKRIARNQNKKRKSPISSRGNVHLARRTNNN